MKKLGVIGIALVIGAGFAFASSMSVPWFVDNAGAAVGFPPKSNGASALIYLHNNTTGKPVCTITYITKNGASIGPAATITTEYPHGNTFTINPNATVAFRPATDDPESAVGGQESDAARTIPNRPTSTTIFDPVTGLYNDGAKNGAIKIEWPGLSTDVQGILVQGQYIRYGGTADLNVDKVTQWGTLLPPGASN